MSYTFNEIFIKDLPGTIVPPETPFETPGEAPPGKMFYYLTNRSTERFTLLLDKSREKETADASYSRIPMGYTQLWYFEKVYAVHPKNGTSAKKEKIKFEKDKEYPKEIERKDWARQLYVVLREPLEPPAERHDVMCYSLSKQTAIELAEKYTRQTDRRALVALMHGDYGWH